MRRGTTPTHTFTTDIDLTDAEVVYITYQQNGKTVFEKEVDEATITSDSVAVTLTQKETLSLGPTAVSMQIRARFADGTAVASNIIKKGAEDVLKDGEI